MSGGRPAEALSAVFVSYRRHDSADIAGRICDHLAHHVGRDNLFNDVDSIPAGADFRRHIQDALSTCGVLLVIIGKQWLVDAAGTRRLDDPDDFVRFEIETALQRNVRVIPVLVQGAALPPPSELPHTIRELAYRQARPVRVDPDFKGDMLNLVNDLGARADASPSAQAPFYIELSSPPKQASLSRLTDPKSPSMAFPTYAAISAVPICLAVWIITGAPMRVTLASGLPAAAGFGLCLGYLYQDMTLEARFNDQKMFVARLKGALSELSYFPKTESDSFLTFAVDWRVALMAGRISARIDRESARIVGPKMFVEKLRRRLTP